MASASRARFVVDRVGDGVRARRAKPFRRTGALRDRLVFAASLVAYGAALSGKVPMLPHGTSGWLFATLLPFALWGLLPILNRCFDFGTPPGCDRVHDLFVLERDPGSTRIRLFVDGVLYGTSDEIRFFHIESGLFANPSGKVFEAVAIGDRRAVVLDDSAYDRGASVLSWVEQVEETFAQPMLFERRDTMARLRADRGVTMLLLVPALVWQIEAAIELGKVRVALPAPLAAALALGVGAMLVSATYVAYAWAARTASRELAAIARRRKPGTGGGAGRPPATLFATPSLGRAVLLALAVHAAVILAWPRLCVVLGMR